MWTPIKESLATVCHPIYLLCLQPLVNPFTYYVGNRLPPHLLAMFMMLETACHPIYLLCWQPFATPFTCYVGNRLPPHLLTMFMMLATACQPIYLLCLQPLVTPFTCYAGNRLPSHLLAMLATACHLIYLLCWQPFANPFTCYFCNRLPPHLLAMFATACHPIYLLCWQPLATPFTCHVYADSLERVCLLWIRTWTRNSPKVNKRSVKYKETIRISKNISPRYVRTLEQLVKTGRTQSPTLHSFTDACWIIKSSRDILLCRILSDFREVCTSYFRQRSHDTYPFIFAKKGFFLIISISPTQLA